MIFIRQGATALVPGAEAACDLLALIHPGMSGNISTSFVAVNNPRLAFAHLHGGFGSRRPRLFGRRQDRNADFRAFLQRHCESFPRTRAQRRPYAVRGKEGALL